MLSFYLVLTLFEISVTNTFVRSTLTTTRFFYANLVGTLWLCTSSPSTQ